MPPFVPDVARLGRRVAELHRLQTDVRHLPTLRACDIVASVPQTEVWVAVPGAPPAAGGMGGGWAVAQAKLAAYDVPVADYPANRKAMRGGEAARLVRRWGRVCPPGHPAERAVRDLARGLGTAPRRVFKVIELPGGPDRAASPFPAAAETAAAALGAIERLLPLLGPDGLARLRAILAR